MAGGPQLRKRTAGPHAYSQARALSLRMLALGGAALSLLLLAWLVLGLSGWPPSALALAAIATLIIADRRADPAFGRWLRGAEGEKQVGAIFDGFTAQGWHVTHDVCLGRGNIDHVLVGPGGIFAVETKAHRGRIALDRLDPKMLKQAYGEKKPTMTVAEAEELHARLALAVGQGPNA
jgi:Nuclease-related domain